MSVIRIKTDKLNDNIHHYMHLFDCGCLYASIAETVHFSSYF